MTRGAHAAVVSPCGGANGLAAIRSLGRLGVHVTALDTRSGVIGHRSRYARPAVGPPPLADEAGFIARLLELAQEFESPSVILPTNDEVLNAVSRNRDKLSDRYLYPFPEWKNLRLIQDKLHQIRTAEEAGIPTPRTSEGPTADFGFPVLVKPADPAPFQERFNGLHAFQCDTEHDLADAFSRSLPFRPLVQELIPGGDDELYTFGAYVSGGGEVLGVFSGRKLRQTPAVVGTCRVGEALWVEEVVAQGLAFVRALGFTGICQVEFKRDPRDGRYKLMEINPRLWQWHGLAAACGVDVVRLAYADLTGQRPAAVEMKAGGRKWAITFQGASKPALLKPPYVDAYFARDDPSPAMHDAIGQVRAAASSLLRRRSVRG